MTPEEAGLARASLDELRGGDAAVNASALRAVLEGAGGAFRDIVLLNAAAALIVAGLVDDLRQGVERARIAIDAGAAQAVLRRLIEVTRAGASDG